MTYSKLENIMNLQRATIEVTSINYFLESTPETASWKLNLSGEFTTTSQSTIGGNPTIIFKNNSFELQDKLVLISLKPLSDTDKSTRVDASEPWHSNDDCRDALRIDGLKEGGYIHSQISIYLDQNSIDCIRNANLQTHRVIVNIEFIDGVNDPRPLAEETIDHLFTYLTRTSIHILSQKDGYHRREYFKLLEEQASSPLAIEKIEPVTDLLKKIINDYSDFRKTVKISLVIIIALTAINLLRS